MKKSLKYKSAADSPTSKFLFVSARKVHNLNSTSNHVDANVSDHEQICQYHMLSRCLVVVNSMVLLQL